ncbi:hypothetical protein Tco_0726551 [Tanacetum coccineum]|uniref:Uncharacterized protein n=1 Tax=Tanacetum coccineum TaxID=301880 RepID=A0ABQ4YGT6_9ASTR
MDNVNEVFDSKVTIRGTLHTLISIKELLSKSGNERRKTMFCSTVYKIVNNTFDFGRQEFCLITGFSFGKLPKDDSFKGLQTSPFCDRVFPEKIAHPLNKVKLFELLEVTRSHELWSALSDEDGVKVCLLLVSSIVFMGWELKNYIADNILELVDFLVGMHIHGLTASLLYILEMYKNNKYWWKKDQLVISRGLAWSKIDKFEKGNYGALFDEYGQHNDSITALPQILQQLITDDVEHEPPLVGYVFEPERQLELQSKPVVESHDRALGQHSESVPMFTRDGDPSIVFKELAVVKERINTIERFIKSRNEDLLEDSVAKQFVQKEFKYVDGKPNSAIADVFIGELSCDKLGPNIYGRHSVKNDDMCEQFVHDFYDDESSKLYYADPKEYPSSCMTQLLQVAVPEQTSTQMVVDTSMDFNLPDLNESFTESQVNCAGFDFDNTDNDSLNHMVKTRKEEIHVDELASENGEQGLNMPAFVEGENYEMDKVDVNCIDV